MELLYLLNFVIFYLISYFLEGGILDDKNATYDAYMNTLRGYFSTIREAVADKVSDPLIAQEFSIEGFKNEPYGIERSTKEIRKQIKVSLRANP